MLNLSEVMCEIYKSGESQCLKNVFEGSFKFLFSFKDFTYLFDRESEQVSTSRGEQQAEGEGEAGFPQTGSPEWGSIPGLWGPDLS